MKTFRSVVALAALALGGGAVYADSFFDIFADGLQETPPNASPATGSGTATLIDATNQLQLHFDFSGLVAPETASHLHVAPQGVAGPIIIPLPLGSPQDGVFQLTAQNRADLLNGLVYLNVHSTSFPGGEIRGQLHLIPEPASLALLALGGVALFRRR